MRETLQIKTGEFQLAVDGTACGKLDLPLQAASHHVGFDLVEADQAVS